MSTRFPGTGIDDGTTLPNPAATDKTNNFSHSALHGNTNDAVKAVETKLGTGSSTPANNTFLIGDGAGTSSWSSVTSAQMASRVSDETGSGSLVFATTPTLVTPKVDTINENTSTNGVTIDGLNIKDGALNTNNSVVSSNITNASVTPNKLSLGAQQVTVTTSETTASTAYTDLATTTDTVTVSVGTNGLLLVMIYGWMSNSGANNNFISFTLSGANTQAAADTMCVTSQGTQTFGFGNTFLLSGLAAGSTTVKMKYRAAAGTSTFVNRRIWAIPL